MYIKRDMLLIVTFCCLLLFGCEKTVDLEDACLNAVFPNKWIGDIDQIGFNEPSGICWHAGRGTLFVAGDEGDVCEIKTDGTLVKQKHIRDADFEGITYDPSSGLLYVVEEEAESVIEIDPDTFEVIREFSVPRQFEGKTLLAKGAEGFEGITFIPDPDHEQGGIFYIANQAFTLSNEQDISAIFKVELPLRNEAAPVKIIDYYEPGIIDLSGLHYDKSKGSLLVISDAANMILEYTPEFELLDFHAFPGDNQEGITVDSEGHIYIAQDSGGIIKLKWLNRK